MSRTRTKNNVTLGPGYAGATMRVKNIGTATCVVGGWVFAPGQEYSWTSPGYASAASSHEGETGTIVDNPGHIGGIAFPYRELQHDTTVFNYSRNGSTLQRDVPQPLFPGAILRQWIDCQGMSAFEAFNSGSGDRWSPTFSTTTSTARAFARSAMNWEDPQVRPELSLIRSVAELKDFKDIFISVLKNTLKLREALLTKGWQGTLYSLVKSFDAPRYKGNRNPNSLIYQRWINAGRQRSWKAANEGWAKKGIDLDFLWKFAVEPLLNDIRAVNRLLDRLNSTVRDLNRLGKPYRVRGQYTDVVTVSDSYTNQWRDHSTSRSAVRTTTAFALVQREPFNASMVDGLIQLADLRLRMSTLFDLAPLSFVYDWFLSIGNALRAAEGWEVRDLPLRVLASGYSSKIEITGATIVYPFRSHANGMGVSCPLNGSYVKKSYSRTPEYISPATEVAIPFPTLRLPNLGKLWTLTELIFQAMTAKNKRPSKMT